MNRLIPLAFAASLFALGPSAAQEKPWEPVPGQSGKDVVWVPTPDALVEKMLDMAAITPKDFVMDLGSGDGRNVIAAAKRGTPALGVEYNEKMVELARQRAAKAGVPELAQFVQGDMYAADISKASVLALFLLTENLDKLAPKFLDLKPGSRIVMNYFTVSGWTPDRSERIAPCDVWCTAHLYIVPAKVAGNWQLGGGTLALTQEFQKVSGTLTRGGKTLDLTAVRLEGDRFFFTAGGVQYEGTVNGGSISGVSGPKREPWTAKRV